MSTTTRVNGAKTAVGVVYANNCNLYLISVKTGPGVAVNLTAEDSAGINLLVDKIGVVEAIELCPLAYFTTNDTTGNISVVLDLAINDATALQTRIRTIGKVDGSTTTSIGPNTVDISGTIVAAATSFTVA
jgi:hypothetical protein